MKLLEITTVLIILSLSQVACSMVLPEEPVLSQPEENFFEGTPIEYVMLWRACLEDGGVQTYDLPDAPDGFRTSMEGLSNDEYRDLTLGCTQSLGEVKTAGLSEQELQERYDDRLLQWACFVDKGIAIGEAPSLDLFIDEYQRSGQKSFWEPSSHTLTEDAFGNPLSPSDICPRTGKFW